MLQLNIVDTVHLILGNIMKCIVAETHSIVCRIISLKKFLEHMGMTHEIIVLDGIILRRSYLLQMT